MLLAAFVNPTCFNQHIERQRRVKSVREDTSGFFRMDLLNVYLEQGGKLSGDQCENTGKPCSGYIQGFQKVLPLGIHVGFSIW